MHDPQTESCYKQPTSDTRLWVQDHHTKVWHWYGSGHRAYAACGLPPIPGSPLVWGPMPNWGFRDGFPEPLICQMCKFKYEIF
jgi:hypothetical protein